MRQLMIINNANFVMFERLYIIIGQSGLMSYRHNHFCLACWRIIAKHGSIL